jgi:hypothetical protein
MHLSLFVITTDSANGCSSTMFPPITERFCALKVMSLISTDASQNVFYKATILSPKKLHGSAAI